MVSINRRDLSTSQFSNVESQDVLGINKVQTQPFFRAGAGADSGGPLRIAGGSKGSALGLTMDGDVDQTFSLVFNKLVEGGDAVWKAGASVNYPVTYDKWVEVGTSTTPEQPYFYPAYQEAISDYQLLVEKAFQEGKTLNWVIETIAKRISEKTKQNIDDKNIIDTGFLRGSVNAIPLKDGRTSSEVFGVSGFGSNRALATSNTPPNI